MYNFPNKLEALTLLKLNSLDVSKLSPKELLDKYNELLEEFKNIESQTAKVLKDNSGIF